MTSRSERIRHSLLVALAAGSLTACGERAAGESAGAERRADLGTRAQGPPCPSVADIGTAVGSPVTYKGSFGGTWGTCMYELTGRYRGVFIELTTQPPSRADEVYAELRRVAKGMNGSDAKPDTVRLGEGGLAFGSGSMSRAAVVAKGRLYQANMQYMGFESIGDQKDAMIKVLELAIR